MNQIRSRINALRRKMALEISVVRLRPLADDFCLQWSVAVSLTAGPPPTTIPSSAGWPTPDSASPLSWPPTDT